MVIRFSSIGDIVLTTPVVRALQQQLGAEVHYLTKKAFAPILQPNPYISKIHVLQEDFGAMMDQLRAEGFDYIVDLHHNLRTRRIRLGLPVPAAGFAKLNFEKWLLVRVGINRLPDLHIVDRYMSAAAELGVKLDHDGLDFFIPPDGHVNVHQMLGIQESKFVSIVTGAAHHTKCLTSYQISQICDQLHFPIVLLGGKDEAEKAATIIKGTNNTQVYNACGQFDIMGSASVLAQSASILTHDTGLMHIAAALKKPQVVVWGNTIPEFGMYPFYGSHHIRWISFEQDALTCRPCSKLGYDVCPKSHFRCIMDHDLNHIAEAVLSLM